MKFLSRKKVQNLPPRRRQVRDDAKRERQSANDKSQKNSRSSTNAYYSYRKGRTLTGSTKHLRMQGDERALKNATPRERAHHLAMIRRRLAAVLVITVVLGAVIITLIEQFSASPDVVATDSTLDLSSQDQERYSQTIQSYLQSRPFERFRFNTNVASLEQYIQAKHAEVKSLEQKGFSGIGQTRYEISLRKPVVMWQFSNVSYYVDSQGVSFQKNFYSNPSIRIDDDSGAKHSAGTAIASERFLRFVGKAIAFSKENNMRVKSVRIPAGTTRQVEIRFESVAYPVIMSIDRSTGEQVEDTMRTVSYLKRKNKKPKYIDVRVSRKVFYRL